MFSQATRKLLSVISIVTIIAEIFLGFITASYAADNLTLVESFVKDTSTEGKVLIPEAFTMNGTSYLAIPGLADGNGGGESQIIIPSGYGTHSTLQTIPDITTNAVDKTNSFHYFTISTKSYLAAGTEGSGAYIYEYSGATSSFNIIQHITGIVAPGSFTSYVINSTTYLGIGEDSAEGGGSVGGYSKIYAWDGTSFIENQSIYTKKAGGELQHISISGEDYMINVGIGTGQVLKWDGTGFNTLVQDLQIIDSFSFISSGGVPSINTFTVGTDSYLVVTQKISNPGGKIQLHIYKWNGTLFVLHQTIDGLDSTLMDLKHTPEIFSYNGKTYMLVMGLDGGYSKLYEWSTNGTFDFVQIINGFYASIHSDFFSVDEKNMILGYDFLQKQYKYYQWTPIPYANIVNPTDGTIAIPQTWDASTTPITGSGTPGAGITITDGNRSLLGTGIVDPYGNFSINTFAESGMVQPIRLVAVESGKSSEERTLNYMDISNTGSDIKYTTFTDISVGNVSFVPDGKNVTLFSGAISTTAISTGTIQSILIRPGTGTTLGVQAFTDDILSVRFNGSEFATITLTDFPPNDNHLISKTVSLPINYQNTGTITIVGGPIKTTPSATGSYSFNVELSSIQNIDGKAVTFTQNALTGNTTTIYQSPTVIIKDASVAAPLNNKIYGGISQEVGRFALQAGGENRILTGLTIEATGSFIYTLSDIVDASSIELWDAETNTKIDATTSIINDNFIFFTGINQTLLKDVDKNMKVVFTSVKSLDSNYGNTIRLLFAPSGIGEGPGNINFPSVISGNSIGKIYTFSVISPTVLISPNSSLSQNNRLATVRITNNDTNTGITLSGITLSFSASTTAPSGLTFNSTLCLRDMGSVSACGQPGTSTGQNTDQNGGTYAISITGSSLSNSNSAIAKNGGYTEYEIYLDNAPLWIAGDSIGVSIKDINYVTQNGFELSESLSGVLGVSTTITRGTTPDTAAPVITLSGASTIEMYIGDMLIDDGATWTDNVDGTGIISHYNTGSVDTGAIGTYTIGYQHTDIAGNTGSVTRTVNVNAHVVVDPIADTTPPVITLSGASSVNIEFGSDFVDAGASWTDNVDGSGIISRYNTGSVNTGAIGTYNIGYQHADVVGNTGSVARTVNVVDTTRPSVTINTRSGQLDPTTTTGALYTVVFSEQINKSTFTKGTLSTSGSTASGIMIDSIAEVAPNNGTTFEVSISASGTGKVALSIFEGTESVSLPFGTGGDLPSKIIVDNLGNIYTANLASNNVSKITPDGTLTILGTTGSGPSDIAVDNLGNIYTSNQHGNNVSKITPDGTSTILGTTGNFPSSLIIDGSGNIYTANGMDNNVSKITPDGTSTILGRTGYSPSDITIDTYGNIYTSNQDNNVSKITPDGTSTILGTTGNSPLGIAIDSSGNIYTSNQDDNNVSKITPDGTSTILGTTGFRPNELVIDTFGNIYTANGMDNNVSKITPDGTSTILGRTGYSPSDITIDTYGNIYTSNIAYNNITKITPSGITDLAGNYNLPSTPIDNEITIIDGTGSTSTGSTSTGSSGGGGSGGGSSVTGSTDIGTNLCTTLTGQTLCNGTSAPFGTGTFASGTVFNTGATTIRITSSGSGFSGTLDISGSITTIGPIAWSGVLIPPTLLLLADSGSATLSELTSIIGSTNISRATLYETVKVGADSGTSIIANSGGYMNLSFQVPSASSGTVLTIYRSSDGNSWSTNTPDSSCIIDGAQMCHIHTDHLSYFAPVSISAPVVSTPSSSSSSSSGPGGGGYQSSLFAAGSTSTAVENPTAQSTTTSPSANTTQNQESMNSASQNFIPLNMFSDDPQTSEQSTNDDSENTESMDRPDAAPVGSAYISVNSSLRVRSSASFNASVMTYLNRNDKIEILDNDAPNWSHIQFANKNNEMVEGYIPSHFARQATDKDMVRDGTISYAEAIDTMPELVGYIQVAHSLNLRARPSMYARIKDVLKPFTQVIILDTMGKWTEILTEKFHGFVASKYIHSGE